jgi:hypothetical protein
VLIVPIRHHSPAGAMRVGRLIRERQPRVVLIEGPADATPLIDQVLDPSTVPPIALYAFRRVGDDVRAAYFPFCDYSPEYVALQAGREVGAEVAFCDLPSTVTLEWGNDGNAPEEAIAEADGEAAIDLSEPAPADYAAFAVALAEASGCGSFEAFWEAAFEQAGPDQSADGYIDLMSTFGSQARVLSATRRDGYDCRRERAMADAARQCVARGVPDDAIVLICGAAHAQAIAEVYAEDAPRASSKPDCVPTAPLPAAGEGAQAEIALIPYSFPRLSEQAGYGAGNRAPWYYQQVWSLGGDYGAATRRAMVVAARHLRERGYSASTAQAIDADTLAATLAAMREKRAPGVDELIDAAVACFGQGHGDAVAGAIHQVLIGDAVGRITGRAGQTPLQEEFHATAQRLGLPVQDAPKQILVHLAAGASEAERSVFLHRLGAIGVPYARELASGLGGQLARGPLERLGRARERWELQWTPATEARLVERTAWGSTLTECCGRLLRERLSGAERIDAGTETLLQMALCDLTASSTFTAALARCEELAADSGSFPALARATFHLDGLLSYGSARKLPADRLLDLAGRLFARATVQLPSATVCGDEGADEVRTTLLPLHELVQRGSPVVGSAGETFWTTLEQVAERQATHATVRGIVLILLELSGRLRPGGLTDRLRYWLSAGADASDNARLVAGLFSLHRATLVRNRALIGAVTDYLLGLELDQLRPLLPVLRRGLGDLGGPERAYLSETLASVLGLDGARARQALRMTSTDRAWLQEADRAVAATLDDWKTKYGIGA